MRTVITLLSCASVFAFDGSPRIAPDTHGVALASRRAALVRGSSAALALMGVATRPRGAFAASGILSQRERGSGLFDSVERIDGQLENLRAVRAAVADKNVSPAVRGMPLSFSLSRALFSRRPDAQLTRVSSRARRKSAACSSGVGSSRSSRCSRSSRSRAPT